MAGRRQHGEGSLFRRARDDRWVAVAELGKQGGKRHRRYFTADNPKDALDKRTRFLDRKRDGFTMPKGRQPTVAEWMLHWVHNVAKRKVEPTTWRSYRQQAEDHIVPYFENVALPDLNEEDIEAWHEHLEAAVSERTGQPLSAGTICHAHRIMSIAIKAAVVRGKLPRNPLSNVPPPKADEREIDPPSQDEVRLLLERCKSWPNGARWVLAITTGLRQGEALGLEWKDVKLAAPASVRVRQAAAHVTGQGRVIKGPKSDAGRRTVPLPAVAVEALRELRDASVRSVRDDFVFRGLRGRPAGQKQDWQDWRALLDDTGLPHYRVHDLRHGYATMLLEAGTDPRVVQELLGWSTTAMLKRYQHVRHVMHDKARDAIDRALGGA